MKGRHKIPFNHPSIVGRELEYIEDAVRGGRLAGDGPFTQRCQKWLEERCGAHKVLLTHSCTAALELAALLCEVGEGDEVIMPSFTFVSTANAFVLRGARPVFVDIRPDTLNLDEALIEAAITSRTRAVVPVHYAGVSCAMEPILEIARRHGLRVIEDAAQGLGSTFDGRSLGTLGDLGCWSFHETKNFISGEGGALIVQDEALAGRAEILREKGTNRARFFRGEVDKYTWVDIGSSYLPSELVAAYLFAQLERSEEIMRKRRGIFETYRAELEDLELQGAVRLPVVPDRCEHNGHMFYLLLPTEQRRDELIAHLDRAGINAVFHYVPLHESPMGSGFGYAPGDLPITESASRRLLRLPCYFTLGEEQQMEVIVEVRRFFVQRAKAAV
ncbi:MAG TPA: dTDP-4-amino-4,6-dideoxygalactose transaminase [Thermoanaerobaculia bacterium]|nr:dTDP-4-amino-4,6-dideoxygalactose transaminase [Thermoanaerobaculia bacterium]